MKTTEDVRAALAADRERLLKNHSELPRTKELTNQIGKVIKTLALDLEVKKVNASRK